MRRTLLILAALCAGTGSSRGSAQAGGALEDPRGEPPVADGGRAATREGRGSPRGAEDPTAEDAGADAVDAEASRADARPPSRRGRGGRGSPSTSRVWELGFGAHPTLAGSLGGVRVPDAFPAPTEVFRLQLAQGFFAVSSFFGARDPHSHLEAYVAWDAAVARWLELFASVLVRTDTNDWEDPPILLTLGDLTLGAKLPILRRRWLAFAAEARAFVPTSDDLGPSLRGAGFSFGALASIDLRRQRDATPFVARLQLRYAVDRTRRLVRASETARYEALPDPAPRDDETRHLLTAFERFALGIRRTDMFDVGLGVEVPLAVGTSAVLSPLVEWTLGVPVNRQGYDCPLLKDPATGRPVPGVDGCYANTGLAAAPMSLTLGARIDPGVRGFSVLAALDLGLTGAHYGDAVRELPANPPYLALLGVSYAFDLRGPAEPEIVVREIETPVEVVGERPPSGRVRGAVLEAETLAPVAAAEVRFPGRDLARLLTDEQGRFTSDLLPPGEVAVELSHPDYDPGSCSATIPAAGGDVELGCELRRAVVIVETVEVQIRDEIRFAFDRAEILPESFPLMTRIAEVLQQHPEITSVEVQGHTDDRGGPAYNQRLSQRRAEAVVRWLTEHGVAATRLVPMGYGTSRPLSADRDEAARARNRRVQFIITSRSDAVEATP